MTSANKDPALMNMVRELSGMFQDFYAERLAKFYVLHVNWLYRMMYTLAKPMLAKKTKQKMEILGSPTDLLRFVDSDQLVADYGGTNTYIHPYPAN